MTLGYVVFREASMAQGTKLSLLLIAPLVDFFLCVLTQLWQCCVQSLHGSWGCELENQECI